MSTESIRYFEKGGNSNFPAVVDIVKNYIQTDTEIRNVAVFAGNMNSVELLYEQLKECNVSITVATYAYGREFYKVSENNKEPEAIIPQVANKESKKKIMDMGMNYIQGGLPFEPIRSCTGDNSLEMIVSTFAMISKGLVHCVSAAIMTKENGYLEEGERMIAISGDTAIVVTPSLRRDLFEDTFKIHKILCKPY